MNYFSGCIQLLVASVLLVACTNEPKKETPSSADSLARAQAVPQTISNNSNPYEAVDVSPMDMSYFPVNYPLKKLSGEISTPPLMRVIYSRPHLNGRSLFGNILKYDVAWRLGANEATELDVYKTVYLNNKKINPGRYSLYAIPHQQSWTFILNTDLDNWGLKQDSAKDLLHFEVPVTTNNPRAEHFTMVFKETDQGADLLTAWDNILARIPFVIK